MIWVVCWHLFSSVSDAFAPFFSPGAWRPDSSSNLSTWEQLCFAFLFLDFRFGCVWGRREREYVWCVRVHALLVMRLWAIGGRWRRGPWKLENLAVRSGHPAAHLPLLHCTAGVSLCRPVCACTLPRQNVLSQKHCAHSWWETLLELCVFFVRESIC